MNDSYEIIDEYVAQFKYSISVEKFIYSDGRITREQKTSFNKLMDELFPELRNKPKYNNINEWSHEFVKPNKDETIAYYEDYVRMNTRQHCSLRFKKHKDWVTFKTAIKSLDSL